MPRSSSGSGSRVLTAQTGVRLPYVAPCHRSKLIMLTMAVAGGIAALAFVLVLMPLWRLEMWLNGYD